MKQQQATRNQSLSRYRPAQYKPNRETALQAKNAARAKLKELGLLKEQSQEKSAFEGSK